MKPTICLDFDGVFNNYKGYDGDNLGTPREGIAQFLESLSKDYRIIVCTARSRWDKVWLWLLDHDLKKYVSEVTNNKPPAIAYVDDRAICFNGDYDELLRELDQFKAYWED